jgi:hypothetical protein
MAPKKRGRPVGSKKQQTGINLMQLCIVTAAYQQARQDGFKHEPALLEARDAAQKALPNLKTSLTAVKRILAFAMPSSGETESMLASFEQNVSEDGQEQQFGSIRFGDRPSYPRANAANK